MLFGIGVQDCFLNQFNWENCMRNLWIDLRL